METMTSFLWSLRMSSTVRWCTPKQMLFDLARDRALWLNMKPLPPERGGAKGYMSDDAMLESSNLCGPLTALKQAER